MPNRTEVGRHIGVIKGAIQGKRYSDLLPEFSPPEYPKSFPPNPEPQILLREIKNLAETLDSNHPQEDCLPWSSQRVNIHSLFESLLAFTDDHTETIHQEYFPVDQSKHFIKEVIASSRLRGAPLQLPEQLRIALEYTDGQLLAASILCHSASRAVGRNRDQRVDPAFKFDTDTMRQWGASIARFDDNKQFDPPGDTYHFWATFSMGLALKKAHHQQQATCLAYRTLLYYGTDIMTGARKVIGNPLRFKHKEVDRMGLGIGWNLGSKLFS